MRIDVHTPPPPGGAWEVFIDGQLSLDVVWVDVEKLAWATWAPSYAVQKEHQAIAIRVQAFGRIDITTGRPSVQPVRADVPSLGKEPEIPFETHNKRPIDPEACMRAVRAMGRGS